MSAPLACLVRRAVLGIGLAVAAALFVVACTAETVSRTVAVEEPIRVESGQFVPGSLPGRADDGGATSADGGPAAPVEPSVDNVGTSNSILTPGQVGMDFSGHATPTTQTIAVRFADLGSGYWLIPAGAPDPTANGEVSWGFTADFGHDLPPGPHDLLFAAIDASGASGAQYAQRFCVDTPVPDNLNACAPKHAPPTAVLSLTWNTAVDLDLVVQTPSGATVGGKHVTTARAGDAGLSVSAAAGAGQGVLDHDSNRNCVIDGTQREDIVWQAAPAAGTYLVWANLFSACGKPAVDFTVALWLAQGTVDGGQTLVEQPPLAEGELTAMQANGGSSPGLFVGQFQIQ